MRIELSVRDQLISTYGKQLAKLGHKADRALSRAMNHTGRKARTQVRRALVTQTGLARKTIVKAVREVRARPQSLSYTLRTSGGDISLKYFKPRETRAGVTAAPFGKRQLFAGTFVKGGRFPGRVTLNMGGHVYRNIEGGKWGGRVELVDSGVVIPEQLVTGATARSWEHLISSDLVPRVGHELKRILPK